MQNDFNSKLKKKDEDIVELRKKIEDMSNEFARMLKVINFCILNLFRKPWIKCKKELIRLNGIMTLILT